MLEMAFRHWHFVRKDFSGAIIVILFASYTQLTENKQKFPASKFFQLSNSLTFAFPKMGVALYCI
jgi:hypothetical protein